MCSAPPIWKSCCAAKALQLLVFAAYQGWLDIPGAPFLKLSTRPQGPEGPQPFSFSAFLESQGPDEAGVAGVVSWRFSGATALKYPQQFAFLPRHPKYPKFADTCSMATFLGTDSH